MYTRLHLNPVFKPLLDWVITQPRNGLNQAAHRLIKLVIDTKNIKPIEPLISYHDCIRTKQCTDAYFCDLESIETTYDEKYFEYEDQGNRKSSDYNRFRARLTSAIMWGFKTIDEDEDSAREALAECIYELIQIVTVEQMFELLEE